MSVIFEYTKHKCIWENIPYICDIIIPIEKILMTRPTKDRIPYVLVFYACDYAYKCAPSGENICEYCPLLGMYRGKKRGCKFCEMLEYENPKNILAAACNIRDMEIKDGVVWR